MFSEFLPSKSALYNTAYDSKYKLPLEPRTSNIELPLPFGDDALSNIFGYFFIVVKLHDIGSASLGA